MGHIIMISRYINFPAYASTRHRFRSKDVLGLQINSGSRDPEHSHLGRVSHLKLVLVIAYPMPEI